MTFRGKDRPGYSWTLSDELDLKNFEKNISKYAAEIFWVFFLAFPLIIGLFYYRPLPNEQYDPQKHELILSHDIGDGEPHGEDMIRYDEWRNKKTGEIFYDGDFAEHRKTESIRIHFIEFMYGLIGCAFFAFLQDRISGKRFLVSFAKAIGVNAILVTFLNMIGRH